MLMAALFGYALGSIRMTTVGGGATFDPAPRMENIISAAVSAFFFRKV